MEVEIIRQFSQEYRYRLNPATLEIYVCAITQFCNYIEKPLASVTKSDIRNWLNDLSSKKGFKPSTLNNKISGLRVFYRFCYEEGFVQQNPAENLKYINKEDRVPRYLTMEQLTKLRKFLDRQILERAVMEVLYSTGIRISELVAMQKADINWTERIISISEAKGDKGRIVLFTQECATYLKAYLETRADSSPLVFLILNSSGNTNVKSANLVEEWFRYYSNRLGFKVAPHTLRHTFAAHLAYKGMPLECIQELMGHEDTRATRIYTRLYDRVRKQKYDELM